MPKENTYTTLWEQDAIERLYRRFSAVVKPFELPLLEIVIQKCNELFAGKKVLSAFEIGAGTGKYTSIILNGIAQGKEVLYMGIDVSGAQREQFAENRVSFPKNVEIEGYELCSWQEYKVTRKYDVVFSQHSWYGIGGDKKNFEKIKKILSEDGVCFIMLNSKENISHIAIEDNCEPLFSSEDLEKGLAASGLSFERIRSYNYDYSKESFCKDGRLTQHGIDHFSYLYRRELKGDEQNIIDMIENAPEESFRFPTDLIIVKK